MSEETTIPTTPAQPKAPVYHAITNEDLNLIINIVAKESYGTVFALVNRLIKLPVVNITSTSEDTPTSPAV